MEEWECQFQFKRNLDPTIKTFSVLPDYYKSYPHSISLDQILRDIENGKLFGMVECDISVPEQWPKGHEKDVSPYEFFKEFSPIFCTTEIPFAHIGDHMQDYANRFGIKFQNRKLLVGGMSAKRILLATPLAKWYLENGLVISHIYQIVEFKAKRCFKDFADIVTTARTQADCDPTKELIASTYKLLGNSAYGSLIMDKEKHTRIEFVESETKARLKVNDSRFKKLTELDKLFEIELEKKKIKLDLPIYLGFYILQYAKLHMLQWTYQFLGRFMDREKYMYLEMDTDSSYLAIAGNSLRDIIKPDLRKTFEDSINDHANTNYFADGDKNWLVRECCTEHNKIDSRTPGLFKLEARGEEMICLCSKTYILRSEGEQFKFSCKGINKSSLTEPFVSYKDVLDTQIPGSGINKGFRARKNTIFTYQQERAGLSYLYFKRVVNNDGVSTSPLPIVLDPWCLAPRFLFSYKDVLSNDYPFIVSVDEKVFSCIWQAYEYKARIFLKLTNNDNFEIKKEHLYNSEWQNKRHFVMKELLLLKLQECPLVRETLLHTESLPLVYAIFDGFWGIGMNKQLANCCNDVRGSNRLGLLWEEIRNEYVHHTM